MPNPKPDIMNALAAIAFWRPTPSSSSCVQRGNVTDIDLCLPKNQRQHRNLHIQEDVLPYALCWAMTEADVNEHLTKSIFMAGFGGVRTTREKTPPVAQEESLSGAESIPEPSATKKNMSCG